MKKLDKELIKKVYRLMLEKKSTEEIAHITGYRNVHLVIERIYNILHNSIERTRRNNHYYQAIREESAQEDTPDVNPVDRIEEGYKIMINGISKTIEMNVRRQVSDVKKENVRLSERLNKAQEVIDELTRENLKLVELAKQSNWISNLQQKYR